MMKLILAITLVFFANTILAAPIAPKLSYTISDLKLSIDWTPVSDATTYTLHYSGVPYQAGDMIFSVDNGSSTNFSLDMPEGAAFFIAVSANNEEGNSGYSNIEKVVISSIKTGVFLDIPVSNVGYRTQTLEGVTNTLGEYEYIQGETVTFFIGDLVFPTVTATDTLTPLDLASITANPYTAAVNIIRLLQTLDQDGNLDNGITITDNTKGAATSVDFTMPVNTFASSSAIKNLVGNSGSINTTLISTDAAIAQLLSTNTSIAQKFSADAEITQQQSNLSNDFIARRVAHAGGGINNTTYTNSIDALNSNIKKGFQYFEIDFSFTKDKQLVCLHDWTWSFNKAFGYYTDEKITLKEFNNLVKNRSEFQKCNIKTLSEWMNANPSSTIITDVKENNMEALKIILKKLPYAKKRVIPQIYNPDNFEKIKELGFEKIIWTLYRYKGNNKEVLEWVENFSAPFAVTMPRSRAESTLPKDLEKINIPSYIHTINRTKEVEKYINKLGISEIYTDFLPPKKDCKPFCLSISVNSH